MEKEIKIGNKIFIRSAGKDEYWLQDIIYDNPKVLGLGNLVPVNKEKKQSSGGRLDILLKDPEQNSMYEVEVMLGETDPSHIIRAIEYWDNEKRKYPQRQHFCVLVAESFDRRYFNVIQLMSLNIPMIAVQADLLEVNGERILNFTKIIDIYIEPEESEEDTKLVKRKVDDEFERWWKAYPGTDTFTYRGKSFTGSRSMRVKKDECKIKLKKILEEGEYIIDELVAALEYEVLQKKESSLKAGTNKLTFQQNSLTYLNQRTFEPFIELVKAGETIKESHVVTGGTDI